MIFLCVGFIGGIVATVATLSVIGFVMLGKQRDGSADADMRDRHVTRN